MIMIITHNRNRCYVLFYHLICELQYAVYKKHVAVLYQVIDAIYTGGGLKYSVLVSD
jgi:hypothetical protein